MVEQSRPIFGLLRKIEDIETRTEVMTLVQYTGVNTVEELAKYSRAYLSNIEVTDNTLDILTQTLHDEYQLEFAHNTKPNKADSDSLGDGWVTYGSQSEFEQTSKPSKKKEKKPKKQRIMSGAPPTSVFQNFDLTEHL